MLARGVNPGRWAPGRPALLALLLLAAPAAAQVKYPPRAESLDATIHYRVSRTDRDERVRQFRALKAFLDRQGFVADKRNDDDLDEVNPNAEFFTGKVPAASVENLARHPSVLTVLFAPAGFAYPEDAKPVPVRIAVADGLRAADQRALHGQVVAQLGRLGFREAIGYDHRRFTLVRGDLPAAKVPLLLKDLRLLPEGWFAAESSRTDLPQPLRDVLPVKWVEVLADADIAPLAPAIPAPNRAIYTQDLREVADNAEAAAKPLRVELVFDAAPPEFVTALTTQLRAGFGSAAVEGAVRNVVTVSFEKVADLDRFVAENPLVTAVRLPRAGHDTVSALPAGRTPVPAADVLAASRLDKLHAFGHRGRGQRVVVVGSGFPGWEALKGTGLPASTRLIDLTAELSPTLDPLPPDPNRPTGGTAAAVAAAVAAPGADFVLVRIDPSAMFQELTVARFVAGDEGYSEAMQARSAELVRTRDALVIRRRDVLFEYRRAFQDLSDEPEPLARRAAAAKALETLLADERVLAATSERFVALQRALLALGGSGVVLNTLVWESGYAADGFSELSRVIDETFAADANPSPRRFPNRKRVNRPVWVQAASGRVGSVWAGPYLDADRTAAMEFAPPGTPPPAGGWTTELNFLGVVGADGKAVPDLPMGAKLRLTVQWREGHDPEVNPSRDPVRPLTVKVLRQADPAGEKRASDEMEEVARSVGVPVRVRSEPTFCVYEQVVDLAVPAAGRYAVRVEQAAWATAPLPALEQHVEITPRVVAEFVGPPPDAGRPVFLSFAPVNAGVGIPGDAMSALAVGGTDTPTGTASTGLTGGGPGLALRPKPDLLAADTVAGADGVGPGVAAGFVAGFAATAIGAGATSPDFLAATGLKCGSPAVVPDLWLRSVPPAGRR